LQGSRYFLRKIVASAINDRYIGKSSIGSSDARETDESHIEGSFKPKAARVALYFFPTPKLVT